MIWVTWRQHRAQAITCLALFGVLAVLAVTIGIQMRAAFGGDGLPACLARSGGAGCPAVITSFVDRFGHGVSSIMNVPLIAIPGLPVPFNGDGLTFTASLLCAFGLAVLAGLLLRNTIAAIVIAYIGWEIPTTVVALMSGPILIPAPAVMRIGCPAGCPGAGTGTVPPVTGHLGDFVLGVTRSGGQLVVSYLPASRFWTEQLIQGGLYLAVVAIALGAAMWLLHRRTT